MPEPRSIGLPATVGLDGLQRRRRSRRRPHQSRLSGAAARADRGLPRQRPTSPPRRDRLRPAPCRRPRGRHRGDPVTPARRGGRRSSRAQRAHGPRPRRPVRATGRASPAGGKAPRPHPTRAGACWRRPPRRSYREPATRCLGLGRSCDGEREQRLRQDHQPESGQPGRSRSVSGLVRAHAVGPVRTMSSRVWRAPRSCRTPAWPGSGRKSARAGQLAEQRGVVDERGATLAGAPLQVLGRGPGPGSPRCPGS